MAGILKAKALRNPTRLNQFLTSSDLRVNVRQWQRNTNEYEAETGERISDQIRRSVCLKQIAQMNTRQHFDVEPTEIG